MHFRSLCRGKPFHQCIVILQDMPESIHKFDIISFLYEIHFDENRNEISEPDKIKAHFKKLCVDCNAQEAIDFLDEMRSDIDKNDLIEYFKKK